MLEANLGERNKLLLASKTSAGFSHLAIILKNIQALNDSPSPVNSYFGLKYSSLKISSSGSGFPFTNRLNLLLKSSKHNFSIPSSYSKANVILVLLCEYFLNIKSILSKSICFPPSIFFIE